MVTFITTLKTAFIGDRIVWTLLRSLKVRIGPWYGGSDWSVPYNLRYSSIECFCPPTTLGLVSPVVENTVSQLHQCSNKQHPQRDTHHAEPHVNEPLQARAQCQAEGQLQHQGY